MFSWTVDAQPLQHYPHAGLLIENSAEIEFVGIGAFARVESERFQSACKPPDGAAPLKPQQLSYWHRNLAFIIMVLAGRCRTNTAAVGIPNVGPRESWQDYAVNALHTVSELAKNLGVERHLHLWPDKSLGIQSLADRMPERGRLKRSSAPGGRDDFQSDLLSGAI